MPDSFGARLRQQRERQQIALSSIAEQTKIKASLLEGLERDDVSHWPVGIFRRAFIRSYAHAIGLDPGVVLLEFLARYPDPADSVATPETTAPADEAREIGRPPTRLRFLVGSAISSLSRGREGAINKQIPPVTVPTAFEPDLIAAAQLCTELSRAENTSEMASLLPEAARILDAVGLIVWVSDAQATELRPALAMDIPTSCWGSFRR